MLSNLCINLGISLAVYFEQNELENCIEVCEKAIEVGRENKADYALIAKYFPTELLEYYSNILIMR